MRFYIATKMANCSFGSKQIPIYMKFRLFFSMFAYEVMIVSGCGYWQRMKKSIDEFIAERKLKLLLNRVDYTGRSAVKLPEA